VHAEAFRLNQPMSPHAAARLDGVEIDHSSMRIPSSDKTIVIETAGGLFSPLNDRMTMLDMMRAWPAPIILVSRHYIGSINHTLLSIEALEHYALPLVGIIFSDEENAMTESYIASRKPLYPHIRLGKIDENDSAHIQKVAQQLRPELTRWIQ
jgi:dethiobiotin synthetase